MRSQLCFFCSWSLFVILDVSTTGSFLMFTYFDFINLVRFMICSSAEMKELVRFCLGLWNRERSLVSSSSRLTRCSWSERGRADRSREGYYSMLMGSS